MEVGLETERVVAGRAAVLTICVARKRDESMTRTQLRSSKFNCLVHIGLVSEVAVERY